MVTFLAKLFIKQDGAVEAASLRRAYGILCSVVGIGLNVLLFAGKYLAGYLSGSIAITADAFNNLSDAGSSLLTLIGFKFAGMKADAEHPFGHGRFEYLSGLMVAAAIILMGFELLKSSLLKVLNPSSVDAGLLPMAILVVSICVKFYMCSYNYSVGRKISSTAMKATAADSMSDVVATSVVLLSMLVERFADINVDGWCGTLVALCILYAGYHAARDTISPLLGQPPDPELIEQIRTITLSYKEIVGIHDLVVHDYGPGRLMISLHGEVLGSGDIFELHDVIDRAEKELKERLGCDAVIHMDPIAVDDGEINQRKAEVEVLVQSVDEAISIHDFRMVKGSACTNLIFDIVVPFKAPLTDPEIVKRIEALVTERWSDCRAVVSVDHSYVL